MWFIDTRVCMKAEEEVTIKYKASCTIDFTQIKYMN